MSTERQRDTADADHRDELPADLDAAGYVGPYQFPDNSRRRIPAIIYLVIAAISVVGWLGWPHSTASVHPGSSLPCHARSPVRRLARLARLDGDRQRRLAVGGGAAHAGRPLLVQRQL